jgi:hypothetical protein
VLKERGHLGGIALPGRIQLLLGTSAGDLRPGRVHRERASMRDRIGDTEVIAWHGFVPFLSFPSTPKVVADRYSVLCGLNMRQLPANHPMLLPEDS